MNGAVEYGNEPLLLFSPPWLQPPCSQALCMPCWWPPTFSEPAAITVHGLTARRLWATTAVMLALVGVVIGGLARTRRASRFGTAGARLGASVTLVAGLIAVVNGGLVLAIANGGPGSGNGVVGGAAGVVLGLLATVFGGLTLRRGRIP